MRLLQNYSEIYGKIEKFRVVKWTRLITIMNLSLSIS